jgi:cytochrome c-type biogenesis protein CcsB
MRVFFNATIVGLLIALSSIPGALAEETPGVGASPSPSPISAALVRHPSWNFREVGLVPIQSGGRLKPLDTFARDLVLFITGSQTYDGWDPVDLVFSWIALPHSWLDQQFIKIGRQDTLRQIQLDEKRHTYSPRELMDSMALAQYAQEMTRTPPKEGEKLHPRDLELRRTLDRLGTFRAIASGDAWTVVPRDGAEGWISLAAQGDAGKYIREQFVELVRGYKENDQAKFERAGPMARAAVEGELQGFNETTKRKLEIEALLNRTKPFRLAWVLYLVAAVVFSVGIFRARDSRIVGIGHLALVLGFVAHTSGFVMRMYVSGRPPVTNMYESVIWVSFGVIIFAWILYFLHRQVITLAAATTVAAFTLIAADSAPAIMDPSIHPLVAVLRSNYWLTIHVLTITLGYAAFALSLGIANVSLFQYLQKTSLSIPKIASLNQLAYRAVQFGVVLLAAGTILGGIWADESWGRFWGWDPKEVWALIALLCYLVILHAKFANMIGHFGFAAWTVVAFLSVLMAWYGVNFVLGEGKHSYGFSSGGNAWVVAFVCLQLVYVLIAAARAGVLRFRPRSL